ncbi:DUF2752 domain-containing protein [Emticicia sp.]|uniref:DUF2752 domain-containing protein n=1 Tax=Emticicia sp. TaxID=1930953 RepID=UPI003752D1F8
MRNSFGRHAAYYKLLLAVVALAITAYYFYYNPADERGSKTPFFYRCLFYKTTGLYCPGCGGQRAFHELLHGNFIKAFNYNLLIYLVLPLVGIKFYEEIGEKKLMPSFLFSRRFIIILVIFVAIFTVCRNVSAKLFII